MSYPFKPPRHLQHLAKTVNAARTQIGWGVHDDGSVGVEHIMSNNPFAGKAKVWGIANIDDNGDIQVTSNGPGNSQLDEALPQDLVQQIVQFYEKEGLNVRNIHESDPTKTAEVENGLKACPHCGENSDLYLHPTLDKFECQNCGTIGDTNDMIDFGVDPDPDRNDFESDPNYPDDLRGADDWSNYEASMKTAGVSFQGAPAGGNAPASGIVVRPDRQSREEIEAMVGGLDPAAPQDIQKDYVDKMNEGMGTSFPSSDNPFVNRGGSFLSGGIDDHFFETNFEKEAAPAGVPGDGLGDTRNFAPGNQPGFIVVSQYLTPDDNWLFTQKCKGIIAETGGKTSHGAVVARAMGIPAIVDANEASQIKPGDHVTMDPNSGRVDVNGGDAGFQEGEVKKARQELIRFVWSNGQGVFSPVTQPLTGELAELEYTHPGENDRSHRSMFEYMDDNDMIDYGNSTIGVVYSGGTAEYYEKINDEPALTNWLKSNFPTQVQEVVHKQTNGGIYQPNAKVSADDEFESKAPVCPDCGSHSYDVVEYPDRTNGPGKLRCLNDGTIYTWTLYMNPRGGSKTSAMFKDSDEKKSKIEFKVADEGIECASCGHRPAEHDEEGCNVEGCKCSKLVETKKVDSKVAETVAINDTNGAPLKIGDLYLMHSTQYKIPDVVRITNINEKRIEAHIDSDVKGMFPIEIDPSEFANLGYSFEPYVTAKQADAGPTAEILYAAVTSALKAMSMGQEDHELMRDGTVGEVVQKALRHFGDPASALNALNDPDSLSNFMRYYSRKEAARALHVSPKRQKELINENLGAQARNFAKLNLDGTHYHQSTYDLIPNPKDDEIDAYFLW